MCVVDMIYATCMAHPAVIMRTEILRKYGLYYNDEFRAMEDFTCGGSLQNILKLQIFNNRF